MTYICKCSAETEGNRLIWHNVIVQSVSSFEYKTALQVRIGEQEHQFEVLRDEINEFAKFLRNAGEQFDGKEVEFYGRIAGKIIIGTYYIPHPKGTSGKYICRMRVLSGIGESIFEFEPADICYLSDQIIIAAGQSF